MVADACLLLLHQRLLLEAVQACAFGLELLPVPLGDWVLVLDNIGFLLKLVLFHYLKPLLVVGLLEDSYLPRVEQLSVDLLQVVLLHWEVQLVVVSA